MRLLLVFVAFLKVASALHAQPMSLVIGIDGLGYGARGLDETITPNLDQLIDGSWAAGYRGSYTDQAFAGGVVGSNTQQPTVSGPGWSTILTGVWADRHGVVDNQFAGRDYVSNPTYLELLEDSVPNLQSASFVNWTPIDTFIISSVDDADSQVDMRVDQATDVGVANSAAQYIRGLGADVPATVFVALDDVDAAGHQCGSSNDCYAGAIRIADTLVGRMLSAVRSRNSFQTEDWQVIVTSDHGHRASGGHGGHSLLERRIPFIVSSPRVVQGAIELSPDEVPFSHADVAPTVLKHFGVPSPDHLWGSSRSNGSAVTTLLGDFNEDRILDVKDIDILTAQTASGRHDGAYDLNGDGEVNLNDIKSWVAELANTWIGDVNVDSEFNSQDLVRVFQASKFETAQVARWSEGDWTGDGQFNSSDLVVAFQDSGYEQGPRLAVYAVPEPNSAIAFVLGLLWPVVTHRQQLLQNRATR